MADNYNYKRLPAFNPDDYHSWAHGMESHLQSKGLYGAIDHQSNGWVGQNHEEHQQLRYKAYNAILRALSDKYDAIAKRFANDRPADLWDFLHDEFHSVGFFLKIF